MKNKWSMGPSLVPRNEVAIFSTSHLLQIRQEVQMVGNHIHNKRRNAAVWHRAKDFPIWYFSMASFI